jgi:Tfp pilus assembly protein PilV
VDTGRDGEAGFSLIEVVVSFALMALVLTGLAYGVTSAFASIGMAKQRQQGTALANDIVEKVRAVPFASLGMSSTDLTGDSAITTVGATSTFRGLTVVTTAAPPAVVAPHVTTTTAGGITYTRKVYVTASAGSTDTRVVTVVVSWPATGAGKPVVELSTLVTEYACNAQSTSAVCDPYWYASADASAVTIRVTGTVNGAAVDGTLTLNSHHADLTTEQFTALTATGTLPGLTIGTSTGSATVNANADDSLASTGATQDGPPYLTTSVAQSASSGGLIGAHPVGSPASAGSAVATTSANGDFTSGLAPDVPTNKLPFARSSSATGGQTSTLTVTLPSAEVVNLVRVTGNNTTTNTAVVQRNAGANLTVLDDDTVAATVTRLVPTVDVLDLPVAMKPAGWPSPGRFARVNTWTQTVTATSGPSATTTTPGGVAGSLAYWNTSSITTRNNTTTAATIPVAYTRTVGTCTITLGGSMVVNGTSVATTGTSGASSMSAITQWGSPLTANLTYLYRCGAVTQVDLTMSVDMGRAYAEARYASPGG